MLAHGGLGQALEQTRAPWLLQRSGTCGSHSKAARAMAHPAYWRTIRHHAAARDLSKTLGCQVGGEVEGLGT